MFPEQLCTIISNEFNKRLHSEFKFTKLDNSTIQIDMLINNEYLPLINIEITDRQPILNRFVVSKDIVNMRSEKFCPGGDKVTAELYFASSSNICKKVSELFTKEVYELTVKYFKFIPM